MASAGLAPSPQIAQPTAADARHARGFHPCGREPALIADLFRPLCQSDSAESLLIAGFDGLGRLRNWESVCDHHRSRAPMPANGLRAVLAIPAVTYLVLAHNHPSGSPWPSGADIVATARLAAACDVMGVRLHDHFILVDSGYFSFRAAGML